ncbi:Hypothetical protein R9X50_00284900 [Acrodontium crateriforme]|uniref:Sfi1 spindle body domain-containing protein n=1 Tax=Acrodontium crateriforme TaxID=150365 RepID=A0AAQ3M553_9PEZI|nr:Hypothetical protein R9X50_00284900 [Acrodontium crateriforme]
MNNYDNKDELPELSDEDINLLYEICNRAHASSAPPFKALFGAYDQVFAEQNIEPEHDGVVFRLLLRVGENARTETRASGRAVVDLVGHLKSILQAQGITVIENEGETDIQSVAANQEEHRPLPNGTNNPKSKRRVSFDEAKLDETWLSTYSTSIHEKHPKPLHLLSLRPKRGRSADSAKREKYRSNQPEAQPSRSNKLRDFSSSMTDYAEANAEQNPTLLFEPSQTQLEQNAEAFLYTSSFRAARKCLQTWRYSALAIQEDREENYKVAVSRDRKTLLKQAFDEWRAAYENLRQERRIKLHWEHEEERAEVAYLKQLARNVLTHWAASCHDQRVATGCAKRYMLKFRYFKRWQAIAVENAAKARAVVMKKFVTIWREKTARRQLQYEQAEAHLEEKCLSKYYKTWFWTFCSRRVEGWHEKNMMRHAFNRWTYAQIGLQQKNKDAEDQYRGHSLRQCLGLLQRKSGQLKEAAGLANAHYDRALMVKVTHTLAAETTLAPYARTMTLQVNLNLERKAFQIWQRQLSLNQQAAEIQRKRILQSAWTNWNDRLRCRALAQKIDERILVENLYRWVLQERLNSFQRNGNDRLLSNVLRTWVVRVADKNRTVEDAEMAFYNSQRRRRLASAMGRLYAALRRRENDEKVAVEFANAKLLPTLLSTWSEQASHCITLNKWASDARFYTLCTSSIATWKVKTTEHQQQRRRDAYTHVRARVKIRLARTCFGRWRGRCEELNNRHAEAERRAQARVMRLGGAAWYTWRINYAKKVEMDESATMHDYQKLISSSFTALSARQSEIKILHEQAKAFKHESDLALLAAALKRIQWQQFTATRRVESADALWARNRDTHIRQMLRYWSSKVASHRAPRIHLEQDEPESPSLRPASRAASRSAREPPSGSSEDSEGMVPAYLRTPSRSRRAGRFRTVIPTPAPVTPFVFDHSFSATTPGQNIDDFKPEGPAAVQIIGDDRFDTFTPQVTPFDRKLREGGFAPASEAGRGSLKSSMFGRSAYGVAPGGTAKSVRFSRNSHGRVKNTGEEHLKSS